MSTTHRFMAALLFGASLSAAAGGFNLTSPEIKDGQRLADAQVANVFGCNGGNKAPALEWRGAPKNTKSFAVTAYDPDAPTGSGFWHWVVFDIPANAQGLPAAVMTSALPAGARQGRNDAGSRDFLGACPPKGDKPHRYVFTVHALKTAKLDVPDDASPALIGFMINANRIVKASFTAKYGR
jgi:Raf kinase inhibitor-like YbhB/YbcL family protein